ncbi:hypothetical protein BKA62DRAFT_744916 [Auriculariales sp. MPI-PUGE-AT-0066]|nr:hypothetical protein BKA62DRAFT_744916 [Auriculariales sp. MPI-PUGE-AT-0066]
MAPIQLINDAIVSFGKQYADYTAHEHAVRDAMFVLTCALPTIGMAVMLFSRGGWWKEDQRLSMQTVGAAWLASITIFGITIYLQHGVTTRTTFILAVFHEQIEVLIDCVLLGFSSRKSFTYTWVFGLVMLLAVLVIPTMDNVFIAAAIIGGGNDALIALLFLYGKQWYFALGALGHLFSAIMVFTEVIRNIGVVPYNALIFLSVWAHVGFTVMGVMRQEERYHDYDGPSSTRFTLYLAYVLPLAA